MVNDLHPDLIVLTGDFVSEPFFGDRAKAASAAEPCAQLLRQMQARYGLWAVMGNHDVLTDSHRVTNSLRSVGIQVLANQSVPIEAKGARFWLGGVDDVLERNADLDATLHKIPASESVILLAHEPDYADHVARYPVDLQLSGHTHGGQVRVPFLPPPLSAGLGQEIRLGFVQNRRPHSLHQSRLGHCRAPVRMNCPPEITLLTLRPSADRVALLCSPFHLGRSVSARSHL